MGTFWQQKFPWFVLMALILDDLVWRFSWLENDEARIDLVAVIHLSLSLSRWLQKFLLKDCDFDRRDPPLAYLVKRNPHASRGDMKLYLFCQVSSQTLGKIARRLAALRASPFSRRVTFTCSHGLRLLVRNLETVATSCHCLGWRCRAVSFPPTMSSSFVYWLIVKGKRKLSVRKWFFQSQFPSFPGLPLVAARLQTIPDITALIGVISDAVMV